MKMIQLDREKYLRILRTEGVSKALTTLHLDTEGWEFNTFETDAGYQPEMWKDLLAVREFSRELWEISLRQGAAG